MNINHGYISKKITVDSQDSLDENIDRLTSMMSKLTAQDDNQNNPLYWDTEVVFLIFISVLISFLFNKLHPHLAIC